MVDRHRLINNAYSKFRFHGMLLFCSLRVRTSTVGPDPRRVRMLVGAVNRQKEL